MSFTEEDRAVIRDIIAKFLTVKELRTEEMCNEKMDNMEENVKGLNNKLWAIILLSMSILGYNLFGALLR